jgi:hypothetical protein
VRPGAAHRPLDECSPVEGEPGPIFCPNLAVPFCGSGSSGNTGDPGNGRTKSRAGPERPTCIPRNGSSCEAAPKMAIERHAEHFIRNRDGTTASAIRTRGVAIHETCPADWRVPDTKSTRF